MLSNISAQNFVPQLRGDVQLVSALPSPHLYSSPWPTTPANLPAQDYSTASATAILDDLSSIAATPDLYKTPINLISQASSSMMKDDEIHASPQLLNFEITDQFSGPTNSFRFSSSYSSS